MIYNIFGSSDSLDSDILIKIDKPLSINECKQKCLEFDKLLTTSGKKINTNLCTTDYNQLTWVYKGSIDEVNNSIVKTYDLHVQPHGKLCLSLMPRNINLKAARVLRTVVQYLSRSKHRNIIKTALVSDAKVKIDVLMQIDFKEEFDLQKLTWIEYSKMLAFQYGQLDALYNQNELFTKSEIKLQYPKYAEFINRVDPINRDLLQELIIDLCSHLLNYDLNQVVE